MLEQLTAQSPKPIGFSAIITIDVLYTDVAELNHLISALESANYRRRFTLTPSSTDPDGVIAARLVFAREVVTSSPAKAKRAKPSRSKKKSTKAKRAKR